MNSILCSIRVASLPRHVSRHMTASAAAATTVSAPSCIKNKHLWRTSGYIGGNWVKGDNANNTFPVLNPANGSVLANCPRMGVSESKLAADVSLSSWYKWKTTTCKERFKILSKIASLMTHYQEDLAHIITLEAGKPLAEGRTEVAYAMSFIEYYAEEAKRIRGELIPHPVSGRRLMVTRESVGPCALITPWNFPLAMITRKVGPALAAGCTVTIKPSEETPLSALAFCALAEEAGVPPGVINCLTVDRHSAQEVGLSFCHNSSFRKLSFTGSTAVGKWLMQESASTVKRISLENGGNAPFIVFDDADLEVAAQALMLAKFRNAGQTCISANRVFVQEAVYDRFAAILAEKVANLVIGDGLTEGVNSGPLINQKGLSKVENHVNDCIDKGAKVLLGGSPHTDLNKRGGTFYRPTILTGCDKSMKPFNEETFGPLVAMMKFKTEEEAMQMANSTSSGLIGYACTKDLARSWRVSEQLECGMIGINEGAISSELVPFGGVKESGIGREGGHQGINEYIEDKYVCMGLGK